VEDADVPEVAAGTGGADGLRQRFLGADSFDDAVCAEPSAQLLDPCHSFVAALFDDVGGAELAGQLLPRSVAAHRDNPLGPELPGGEHRQQAHSPVPDHHDGLPRSSLGGHRGEPPGSQHV
jgi:hypothetical protein